MSAQHTPGPWAVSKRASRRVTNNFGIVICNAVLRNTGPAKSTGKYGEKAAEEAEANARLIAAAPELLEALEALLADCGEAMSDGYVESSIHLDEVVAARAAIAKATGR